MFALGWERRWSLGWVINASGSSYGQSSYLVWIHFSSTTSHLSTMKGPPWSGNLPPLALAPSSADCICELSSSPGKLQESEESFQMLGPCAKTGIPVVLPTSFMKWLPHVSFPAFMDSLRDCIPYQRRPKMGLAMTRLPPRSTWDHGDRSISRCWGTMVQVMLCRMVRDHGSSDAVQDGEGPVC